MATDVGMCHMLMTPPAFRAVQWDARARAKHVLAPSAPAVRGGMDVSSTFKM